RLDLGALAYKHERLRVAEALGERAGVRDVVVPDFDFVPIELGEAGQRADRVVIVVEDRDLHVRAPSGLMPRRKHHALPRRLATSAACRWRPVSSNSSMYWR